MKLQLITRQSRANGSANRWKNTYFDNEGWRYIVHGSSEDVYNKLAALSSPVDPDEVDRIIGNNSWTRVECDNCGKVASVVTVGQEPDYDSSTAKVCQECLRNALAKKESILDYVGDVFYWLEDKLGQFPIGVNGETINLMKARKEYLEMLKKD